MTTARAGSRSAKNRELRTKVDEQEDNPVNLADAKVAQLLVPIEDFEKGVAFYRDVLGLPFLFAAPPQMAFFNCGGVRLLVGVMPAGQNAQRGSAIYFQVPDIHAVHGSLKSKGVAFRADPHIVHRTPNSELWLAEFADPDGNQLALMSELPTKAAG
jgi:methylmalonyl-CoA/ethylmalonyl-CoA epimerase